MICGHHLQRRRNCSNQPLIHNACDQKQKSGWQPALFKGDKQQQPKDNHKPGTRRGSWRITSHCTTEMPCSGGGNTASSISSSMDGGNGRDQKIEKKLKNNKKAMKGALGDQALTMKQQMCSKETIKNARRLKDSKQRFA